MSPYGQMSFPYPNGDSTEYKHDNENDGIPLGNLPALAHQPSVDSGLFAHGTAGLYPNLLAVLQERMSERSGDRGG